MIQILKAKLGQDKQVAQNSVFAKNAQVGAQVTPQRAKTLKE